MRSFEFGVVCTVTSLINVNEGSPRYSFLGREGVCIHEDKEGVLVLFYDVTDNQLPSIVDLFTKNTDNLAGCDVAWFSNGELDVD